MAAAISRTTPTPKTIPRTAGAPTRHSRTAWCPRLGAPAGPWIRRGGPAPRSSVRRDRHIDPRLPSDRAGQLHVHGGRVRLPIAALFVRDSTFAVTDRPRAGTRTIDFIDRARADAPVARRWSSSPWSPAVLLAPLRDHRGRSVHLLLRDAQQRDARGARYAMSTERTSTSSVALPDPCAWYDGMRHDRE